MKTPHLEEQVGQQHESVSIFGSDLNYMQLFPSICHVCSWSKYQCATVEFVHVYAANRVGILENFNLWCFQIHAYNCLNLLTYAMA